jgi:hypothetical protein
MYSSAAPPQQNRSNECHSACMQAAGFPQARANAQLRRYAHEKNHKNG